MCTSKVLDKDFKGFVSSHSTCQERLSLLLHQKKFNIFKVNCVITINVSAKTHLGK